MIFLIATALVASVASTSNNFINWETINRDIEEQRLKQHVQRWALKTTGHRCYCIHCEIERGKS